MNINDLFGDEKSLIEIQIEEELIDYKLLIINDLKKYYSKNCSHYKKVYDIYNELIDKNTTFLMSYDVSQMEKIYCFLNDINPVCDICNIKKTFRGFELGYDQYCYECVDEGNIKEFCLHVLETTDKRLSYKYLSEIITRNTHIKMLLISIVTHISNDKNITEMVYCLLNDIKEYPQCIECKSIVNFGGPLQGYNIYCGQKCQRHSKKRQQKTKDTIKRLYNVENVSQSPEIQAKKIETNRNNLGVDWPMQADSVQQKSLISFKSTEKKKINDRILFSDYISIEETKKILIQYLSIHNISQLVCKLNSSIALYESVLFNTKNFDKYFPVITERVYVIINNMYDRPICDHCRNDVVNFMSFGYGYYQFCSVKCAANSEEVRSACSNTCLELYGVNNTFQSDELMKDAHNKHIRHSKVSQELFWSI